MNRCNDFGQCDHGHGCPAGAVTLPPMAVPLAKAARTCEALGVCQHPERECIGACEQKPRMPVADSTYPADPTAPVQSWRIEDFGRDNLLTAVLVAALSGATLGIVYGAGRWLWQAWQVLA